MSFMRLHPDDLTALADMIAERLAGQAVESSARALLDSRAVASHFGVTPEWVRENAERHGVIRPGDGPRPRLRFDPDRGGKALSARPRKGGSDPPQTPVAKRGPECRASRRSGNEPGLLPIR